MHGLRGQLARCGAVEQAGTGSVCLSQLLLDDGPQLLDLAGLRKRHWISCRFLQHLLVTPSSSELAEAQKAVSAPSRGVCAATGSGR